MTLGMMAAPVGRGTEVGVFSGVGYGAQTGPIVTNTNPVTGEQTNSQTQNRVFNIPAFEANVQKGFNDHIALNVHVSPAGIQPGLKWTRAFTSASASVFKKRISTCAGTLGFFTSASRTGYFRVHSRCE